MKYIKITLTSIDNQPEILSEEEYEKIEEKLYKAAGVDSFLIYVMTELDRLDSCIRKTAVVNPEISQLLKIRKDAFIDVRNKYCSLLKHK